jgi:malonyl-CoA/methylmalonyl-CoA synthetase
MTDANPASAGRSELLTRFDEMVAARGAAVAVVSDSEQVSFAELGDRARRIAAELRQLGLANHRIALLATQDSRWLEAFFGIALAGSIVVPLSHLHPESERTWFVEVSDSSAVLASSDLLEQARQCAKGRPVIEIESLRASTLTMPNWNALNSDPALILYTSGTTGKPKGALMSHGNLGALSRLVAEAWKWAPEDSLLHALPLHHLHGLGISLFVSLLAGGRSQMLARFDAARIWEEMGSATVLMGVPTMHKKLLDAFDAADPETRARWQGNARRLRLVTSGSAALPAKIGERYRELTGNYPLERFGMTEIGVGLSNPLSGERVPGSCGLPFPGMQIRIVKEDGTDAANDEPGEIWIRGPSVFVGYDKNEAATRDAFVDGWVKSGDLATRNSNGYVKILGRTSVDILKSGGYKLSALEIEEVLRDVPGVADVAVVGVPDETWGEIAVAAIILHAREELDEEAVRAFCKQRIAPYKVPKRVLFFEDFPRNAVGKVIKPELARRVRQKL